MLLCDTSRCTSDVSPPTSLYVQGVRVRVVFKKGGKAWLLKKEDGHSTSADSKPALPAQYVADWV